MLGPTLRILVPPGWHHVCECRLPKRRDLSDDQRTTIMHRSSNHNANRNAQPPANEDADVCSNSDTYPDANVCSYRVSRQRLGIVVVRRILRN